MSEGNELVDMGWAWSIRVGQLEVGAGGLIAVCRSKLRTTVKALNVKVTAEGQMSRT